MPLTKKKDSVPVQATSESAPGIPVDDHTLPEKSMQELAEAYSFLDAKPSAMPAQPLDRTEHYIRAQHEQIDSHMVQAQRLQSRCAELTKTLQDKDRDLQAISFALDASNEELTLRIGEIRRLTVDLNTSHRQITALATELGDTKTHVLDSVQQLKDQKSLINSLKTQVAGKKKEIHELERNITERNDVIQDLTMQVSEQQQAAAAAAFEHECLSTTLTETNDEAVRLREELEVRTESLHAKENELSSLQTRLQTAMRDADSLKEEQARMTQRLTELQSELEKKEGVLDQKAHLVTTLKTDLDEQLQAFDDLQHNTAELFQELTESRRTVDELQKEAIEHRDSITTLQKSCDQFKANASGQAKLIDALKEEHTHQLATIEEKNTVLARQSEEINRLGDAIKDQQKSRDDLDRSLQQTMMQLQQATDQITKLRDETTLKEQQRLALETTVQDLQAMLQEKTELLDQLGRHCTVLDTTQKNQELTLCQLQETLEERNHLIADLTGQLNQQQNLSINQAETVQRLTTDLTRHHDLLGQAREALTADHAQLQETQTRLEATLADNAGLKSELAHSLKELASKQAAIKHCGMELGEFKKEIHTRDVIIEDLTQQLAQEQTSLTQETETVNNLKDELSAQQILLQQAREELNNKVSEAAQTGRTLSDLTSTVHALQREIEARDTIIEEITQKLSDEQTKLLSSATTIDELNTQLTEAQTTLMKAQKDRQDKDIHISTLKEELKDRLKDLEFRNDELNNHKDEITRLSTDLTSRIQELDTKKEELAAVNHASQQRDAELQTLRGEFQKQGMALILKNIEMQDKDQLITELQERISQDSYILTKTEGELQNRTTTLTGQCTDLQQQLTASKMSLDQTLGEIDQLHQEITTKNLILQDLTQQLNQEQSKLIVTRSSKDQLTEEFKHQTLVVDDLQARLHEREGQIRCSEETIKAHLQQIGDLQRTLNGKIKDLELATTEIQNKETRLQSLKGNLLEATQEVQTTKRSLEEAVQQKNDLSALLTRVENAIPSSIIMTNQEGVITAWNKPSERLFGLSSTAVIGRRLSEIPSLKMVAGCTSQNEAAPLIINASDRKIVADVSRVPFLTESGELQGAIVVIADVTKRVELQTELDRRQADMTRLTEQYQQSFRTSMLLRKEVQEAEIALRTKTQLAAEQTAQLSDLRAELNQQFQDGLQFHQLQSSIREKEMTIDELTRTIRQREHELLQRTEDLSKKNQDVCLFQNQVEKLHHELGRREQEMLHLNQDLDAAQNQINIMRLETEALTTKCSQLESEVPSPVIMVDAKNQVSVWNKKAESFFNVKAVKAIGCDLFNFSFMDRERLKEGYEQALSAQEDVRIKALALPGSSMQEALVDVVIHPMTGLGGEPMGALLVLEDITDRVAIEADLKRKEAEVGDLSRRLSETLTRNAIQMFEDRLGASAPLQEPPKPELHQMHVASPVLDQDFADLRDRKLIAGDFEQVAVPHHMDGSVKTVDTEEWRDRVKTCDEIAKSLDDPEALKSKKTKDPEKP